MTQLAYTTTDSVRAALGLSDIELPDSLMLHLQVEDQLIDVLDQIYPDHVALEQAVSGPSPSAEQVTAFRCLKLFSMYEIACYLLDQSLTLITQKISDSDVDLARFTGDALLMMQEALKARRDQYRNRLLDPENTVPVQGFLPFAIVVPARDPVLEGRTV